MSTPVDIVVQGESGFHDGATTPAFNTTLRVPDGDYVGTVPSELWLRYEAAINALWDIEHEIRQEVRLGKAD